MQVVDCYLKKAVKYKQSSLSINISYSQKFRSRRSLGQAGSLTNNSLPVQNNVCVAAQHSPPQTVMKKLSRGPALCVAWVGMHRHMTSHNQGTFMRQREDPENEVGQGHGKKISGIIRGEGSYSLTLGQRKKFLN